MKVNIQIAASVNLHDRLTAGGIVTEINGGAAG